MKNYIIAIDGACRHIGKPNCVSASGIFVLSSEYNEEKGGFVEASECFKYSEQKSTSQRGELFALLTALEIVDIEDIAKQTWIVTDSGYIRDTLCKGWYISWMNNNWKTSAGSDVKNKDIWKRIIPLWEKVEEDVLLLHIKGHVISYGPVTAANLYRQDKTCLTLYKHAIKVFNDKEDQAVTRKKIEAAVAKFPALNDGMVLDRSVIKGLIIVNSVADSLANFVIEKY